MDYIPIYLLWISLESKDMVGGHFKSNRLNPKSPTYLPLLRRIGSTQLVQYLRRTSSRTSATIPDPVLIAKPTSDISVVSRNIKVVQIQSGKLQKCWIISYKSHNETLYLTGDGEKVESQEDSNNTSESLDTSESSKKAVPFEADSSNSDTTEEEAIEDISVETIEVGHSVESRKRREEEETSNILPKKARKYKFDIVE